jgi:uncharacterized protein (DUF2141 family)
MKSAVALAAVATALAAGASAQDGASLRLAFQTPKSGGSVAIAVYGSEASFAGAKDATRTATVPVRDGRATVVFDDLPPGRYAVAAYHDVNGDGRLNTLPVGLPTEPYGFSNDARGMFGPPKWSAAAFEVSGVAARTIRLK